MLFDLFKKKVNILLSVESKEMESSNHSKESHIEEVIFATAVLSQQKATEDSKMDKLNVKPQYLLDREKQDIVLFITTWLNYVIINAAQCLLKDQFGKSGFQNTRLGFHLSYMMLC